MPGGIGIGVGFCLVGDDVDAEKAYVVVVALLSVLLIIIKQHKKYTATRLRRFVVMMCIINTLAQIDNKG
jgi:hypothetical protein